MRLLVTGAAGFIGSNFVHMALGNQLGDVESILAIDKLNYAGNIANIGKFMGDSRFKFIEGDICDHALMTESLREIDAVINFAAETHVDKSIFKSGEFIQTNVMGLHVILETILESKSKIRLIQISTDEVYGSIENGSWDENSPLLPNSLYSASKASGELLARSYFKTHNLDIVITRCSNNYGRYQFPEKLIPLFVTNLLSGKKIPIYGNGKNVRDWLHVEDHCRGIFAALILGKAGEIYNIGGGRELTNLEITQFILNFIKADESLIEYVEDRKGHDFRYSVDWRKINRELGYEPKIKFEEGLSETIEWYQNNRTWWEPLKKRAGI